MEPYPKIETLYDRDPKTFKVIVGAWRCLEFAYLKDNEWLFTEKVDGTNVRVMWQNGIIRFAGRSEEAQMPTFLLAHLQNVFTPANMKSVFPNMTEETAVCLYGEGYGARIQKGGGRYKPDGVAFILFDVKVDRWWLERENIEDIASKLDIKAVPIVGKGNLAGATDMVQTGLKSAWGDFLAEGVVVSPAVSLWTRKGERVIGKIKTKDF